MPFLFLCLFIGIPVIEIALFISVGGEIGVLSTLILIVATAVIGTFLLKKQGLATLSRAQQRIEQGEAPLRELFDGVCLLIAGCLLLTPGFLTDSVGFLLLLPWVRTWVSAQIVPNLISKMKFRTTATRRSNPHDDIIDGEYTVHDDAPNGPNSRIDDPAKLR